jgi:hypothetical protein
MLTPGVGSHDGGAGLRRGLWSPLRMVSNATPVDLRIFFAELRSFCRRDGVAGTGIGPLPPTAPAFSCHSACEAFSASRAAAALARRAAFASVSASASASAAFLRRVRRTHRHAARASTSTSSAPEPATAGTNTTRASSLPAWMLAPGSKGGVGIDGAGGDVGWGLGSRGSGKGDGG